MKKERIDRIVDTLIHKCKERHLRELDKIHIACIINSRSILEYAINTKRTCMHGGITPTLHAEISVINQFMNKNRLGRIYFSYKKLAWKYIPSQKIIPKNFNKYSIIILRVQRKSNTLLLSFPCKSCGTLIHHLGFNKIYFSQSNGEIAYIRTRNCILPSLVLSIGYETYFNNKDKSKNRGKLIIVKL